MQMPPFLVFNVIGKLSSLGGDANLNTLELRKKLEAAWGFIKRKV